MVYAEQFHQNTKSMFTKHIHWNKHPTELLRTGVLCKIALILCRFQIIVDVNNKMH